MGNQELADRGRHGVTADNPAGSALISLLQHKWMGQRTLKASKKSSLSSHSRTLPAFPLSLKAGCCDTACSQGR